MLIVDDNEITRFITEHTLLEMKLAEEIIFTKDGNEAMLLIREGLLPDLILLDLNMPGMGGFAFLDEYQSLSSTAVLPPNVVVFSTSTRPEDRQAAKEYDSVIGFAEKPITEQKLRLLLQSFGWDN